MSVKSPEKLPPMDLTWIRWLLDSYASWLKRELIDRTGTLEEQSERLFVAPFVVASHTNAEDPILNYGNRQALELWEGNWEEFTSTPSRLTAEPVNQPERARMLEQVATHGFVTDYQGIRISRSGRRFLVQQATVWNILDDHGAIQGQAATFSHWQPLTED
ncbi:MAG: MEKHLA domain-containing protein [Nitrospira sp.]|nr:MEKHLA domain-containing protein [Nitrospira sp.]